MKAVQGFFPPPLAQKLTGEREEVRLLFLLSSLHNQHSPTSSASQVRQQGLHLTKRSEWVSGCRVRLWLWCVRLGLLVTVGIRFSPLFLLTYSDTFFFLMASVEG